MHNSSPETRTDNLKTPQRQAASSGKRIVLTTFGSFGDIHPYMAIALELQARGHQPAIATSALYREKIEGAGLDFSPVRPDIPPLDQAGDMINKLMDARNGGEYLFKELLMPLLRDSYADLAQAAQGADLLVTHVVTLAGPLVAQKMKIPWVSTVLSPISFFSIYDPSMPPGVPWLGSLSHLSPAAAKIIVKLIRQATRPWVKPVYQLRAELGLPPGGHPVLEGQHSPALVLALFSSALAKPQADWPAQTRLTGFCFYDRLGHSAATHAPSSQAGTMPSELAKFLDAGPPPIVFTLGSAAVFDPGNFYKESMLAARQLERRAVLLIGDKRNLPPEPLPEGVAAFDYAPYSEILPRAAAIVHQGGIGTTGQALRAGKPMLVMPYSHDQPDNAARIVRAGVGRTIARNRYTAARAAVELGKLLNEPEYAARAAALGRQVQAEDGTRHACDAIMEQLGVTGRG